MYADRYIYYFALALITLSALSSIMDINLFSLLFQHFLDGMVEMLYLISSLVQSIIDYLSDFLFR